MIRRVQSSPIIWRLRHRESRGDHFPRLDLFIRALSAVGVLTIGLAGWGFQVATKHQQDSEIARERESRSCLPVVRSLTELEVALDDVATLLSQHGINGVDRTPEFMAMSSRVDSAVVSTTVLEHDPMVAVALPNVHGSLLTTVTVRARLTSFAYMFVDLLRVLAIAAHTGAKDPTFRLQEMSGRWTAVVNNGKADVEYVGIRREGAEAWLNWLGTSNTDVTLASRSLRSVARGLQFRVARTMQRIMRQHSEFGEQFVLIRNEVSKDRRLSGNKSNEARPN